MRHAFITAALDAGFPLRDVQEAASLDRHATYIVAAYLAGTAR